MEKSEANLKTKTVFYVQGMEKKRENFAKELEILLKNGMDNMHLKNKLELNSRLNTTEERVNELEDLQKRKYSDQSNPKKCTRNI
jgi:hypothetical protein